MPIVKTEKVFIDGQTFNRKVKCNADGLFTCELPNNIQEDLGLGNYVPEFKSMRDCLNKWQKKITEHENSKTIISKVICFEFEKDIAFNDGFSFSITAGVFEQSATSMVNGAVIYKYSRVSNKIPSGLSNGFKPYNRGEKYEKQIPWSSEHEEFFIELSEAMSTLIGRLEGMTNNTDSMIQLITSGAKLLQKSD